MELDLSGKSEVWLKAESERRVARLDAGEAKIEMVKKANQHVPAKWVDSWIAILDEYVQLEKKLKEQKNDNRNIISGRSSRPDPVYDGFLTGDQSYSSETSPELLDSF